LVGRESTVDVSGNSSTVLAFIAGHEVA